MDVLVDLKEEAVFGVFLLSLLLSLLLLLRKTAPVFRSGTYWSVRMKLHTQYVVGLRG
jgi:hypothetical protein